MVQRTIQPALNSLAHDLARDNEEILNQSHRGIYIDTGLGSAFDTVIPAKAGIQGTVQQVLSWTPARAGMTKVVIDPIWIRDYSSRVARESIISSQSKE